MSVTAPAALPIMRGLSLRLRKPLDALDRIAALAAAIAEVPDAAPPPAPDELLATLAAESIDPERAARLLDAAVEAFPEHAGVASARDGAIGELGFGDGYTVRIPYGRPQARAMRQVEGMTRKSTPATPDGEDSGGSKPTILFLLDKNLGLPEGEMPWSKILPAAGIKAISTTDLPKLDESVAGHGPDIAFMPIADFHRLIAKGDRYYRGFAIATSKLTGTTNLPSVLVVRKDDPANSLDDLEGATYGYINKSCSSSYFPPAIMLVSRGKRLDEFLKIEPTPAWQGQIDAVVARQVRATMVPEDVWKTTPKNAEETKIIDRYDDATPPVAVVREHLDENVSRLLLDALLSWEPKWEAVYGAFRPYYYADVQHFFHDLDQLPAGM
jgi:ABC-type phosphate/phosphonate transport system substrate-binding protein